MFGKAREGSRSSGRLWRAWDGSGGMKNDKNAELYANNYEKWQKCGTVCKRGGVELHPPDFCIQSGTFATFDNWANYEKLHELGLREYEAIEWTNFKCTFIHTPLKTANSVLEDHEILRTV